MMSLEATTENRQIVESLIGQGVAESTGYIHRAEYRFTHVWLTGEGWMRYKEGPT